MIQTNSKASVVRILGVSGGSGSGKTTFARELQRQLGEDICGILSQDHYYIDQSARFNEDGGDINFDHPDALDFELLEKHLRSLKRGEAVEVPVYDFATHRRLKTTRPLAPKPIIVVDGTLILSQERIRSCLDQCFFIDVSEALRFERRFQRDVKERGRLPEGIQKQFQKQVKPMHDLFVEPSKVYAQAIICGSEPFAGPVAEWAQRLMAAVE